MQADHLEGKDLSMHRLARVATIVVGMLFLAACMGGEESPAVKPLSQEARQLLAAKGMSAGSELFVRIFKDEAELEVWKEVGGRFEHYKTYPICAWSGRLGPKLKEGDRQAPEGFYVIKPTQMNPRSQFHLAFNMGYPNAYDRSHGRTGAHLMVHGDCSSRGCYAMTNPQIEEIYALARESFKGGQRYFNVHAFPFRMTEANMARFRGHRWHGFWRNLKEGHDYFELTRTLPSVAAQNGRYVFNIEQNQSFAAAGFAAGQKPVMINPPK